MREIQLQEAVMVTGGWSTGSRLPDSMSIMWASGFVWSPDDSLGQGEKLTRDSADNDSDAETVNGLPGEDQPGPTPLPDWYDPNADEIIVQGQRTSFDTGDLSHILRLFSNAYSDDLGLAAIVDFLNPEEGDAEIPLASIVSEIDNLSTEERRDFVTALNNLSTTIGAMEAVNNVSGELPRGATEALERASKALSTLAWSVEGGRLGYELFSGGDRMDMVRDGLILAGQIAAATAIGGPVGFVAATAIGLWGDEAIAATVWSLSAAGHFTADVYGETGDWLWDRYQGSGGPLTWDQWRTVFEGDAHGNW